MNGATLETQAVITKHVIGRTSIAMVNGVSTHSLVTSPETQGVSPTKTALSPTDRVEHRPV